MLKFVRFFEPNSLLSQFEIIVTHTMLECMPVYLVSQVINILNKIDALSISALGQNMALKNKLIQSKI